MLDPDIYFNDKRKLDNVDRFRQKMKLANVLVGISIVVASVSVGIGENTDNAIYYAGSYFLYGMQIAFLLIWAWTLIKLYKEIKHSKRLLPDKRVFILHGILLGFVMALSILYTVAY